MVQKTFFQPFCFFSFFNLLEEERGKERKEDDEEERGGNRNHQPLGNEMRKRKRVQGDGGDRGEQRKKRRT